MAIKLIVDDFCQDCNFFKVTQEDNVMYSDGMPYFGEHILSCSHLKLCRYMRDKIKKEGEENKNEKD